MRLLYLTCLLSLSACSHPKATSVETGKVAATISASGQLTEEEKNQNENYAHIRTCNPNQHVRWAEFIVVFLHEDKPIATCDKDGKYCALCPGATLDDLVASFKDHLLQQDQGTQAAFHGWNQCEHNLALAKQKKPECESGPAIEKHPDYAIVWLQ